MPSGAYFEREVIRIRVLSSADAQRNTTGASAAYSWRSSLSYQVTPLALPVLIGIQLLFAISLGMCLGILNVFFRDVGQLFAIGLQFWFWLTPIVYPLGILPSFVQPWLALNPMTGLMQAYQGVFVQGLWPNWPTLWPALLAGVVCSFLAVLLIRRREAEMLDEL